MNEHDTTPVPTNEIIVEEVDIEEYVRSKRPIPHANRYVIRIDKEKRVVHTPVLTGRADPGFGWEDPRQIQTLRTFPRQATRADSARPGSRSPKASRGAFYHDGQRHHRGSHRSDPPSRISSPPLVTSNISIL